MSPEAAFEEDILRRSGSVMSSKVTRVSLSLARSVWHTQATQQIEEMEVWAEDKMKNQNSRRHGLTLMSRLAEMRVLVDKAWEEKDFKACKDMEEKLDQMKDLYDPSGPTERVLQHTENMIEYMSNEVVNKYMLQELREGVVSQGEVEAVRQKIMNARASLDAVTSERDMADVYKVNCMVSALVKPYQQKYRRTVFAQDDELNTTLC